MADLADMREVYVATLRIHAHKLISFGYKGMDRALYSDWEEPSLTGELVRSIREFMESDDAPDWADYYSLADDPPLDAPDRFGKSRPRVDIEFEKTGVRGRRPRLRFEAKRLGKTKGHTISAYLGAEGMGCFISGKYPLTHNEAGMLGYIQSGQEKDWSEKIRKALKEKGDKYRVSSPPYNHQEICDLEHTYISYHQLKSGGPVITIHHLLLRFF